MGFLRTSLYSLPMHASLRLLSYVIVIPMASMASLSSADDSRSLPSGACDGRDGVACEFALVQGSAKGVCWQGQCVLEPECAKDCGRIVSELLLVQVEDWQAGTRFASCMQNPEAPDLLCIDFVFDLYRTETQDLSLALTDCMAYCLLSGRTTELSRPPEPVCEYGKDCPPGDACQSYVCDYERQCAAIPRPHATGRPCAVNGGATRGRCLAEGCRTQDEWARQCGRAAARWVATRTWDSLAKPATEECRSSDFCTTSRTSQRRASYAGLGSDLVACLAGEPPLMDYPAGATWPSNAGDL